ncbi:polyprenol monophosphomannose synthase [Marisediminicola sp. LYQ134]|uniref:polyprenol monophosphomannose synthase n=1 Tax=unclassified Marisediminicola TaxID=2618316 RepID=UPI0039831789
MADTLIVLPTFDEIENIDSMVGRIRQSVPSADLLIVDDASPDGTGRRADDLAATDAGISVLHREAKGGLGAAYLAGFDRAIEGGYEFVVEIDADGSHNPATLPAMIAAARKGADLVIGSRWVPGGRVENWPWLRQVISRGGNTYSRLVLGSSIRDLTSGFRVLRTAALRHAHLSTVSSQGYCFQVEMAWRLERGGARVVEHPITFIERVHGVSKMRTAIVVEALARVTWWGLTRALRRVDPIRGSSTAAPATKNVPGA